MSRRYAHDPVTASRDDLSVESSRRSRTTIPSAAGLVAVAALAMTPLLVTAVLAVPIVAVGAVSALLGAVGGALAHSVYENRVDRIVRHASHAGRR